MEKSKKKLTLDEVQLESFVTSLDQQNAVTVEGGTWSLVGKSILKVSKAASPYVSSAWLSYEVSQATNGSAKNSGKLCEASGCVCVKNSKFPESYKGG